MAKTYVAALIAGLGLALVAGCGQSEVARENLEEAGTRDGGEAVQEPSGTDEQVVIGGYEVEGPEGRNISVPEATVEREELDGYVDEVRPVIEDTVRDVSGVLEPEASFEDGRISVGIDVESVEEARDAAEEGLEELREIEPPDGLEQIHERLVEAYERAIPAYEDILSAAESGNAADLAQTVEESFPEIERLAAESRAILQALESAESQGIRPGSGG